MLSSRVRPFLSVALAVVVLTPGISRTYGADLPPPAAGGVPAASRGLVDQSLERVPGQVVVRFFPSAAASAPDILSQHGLARLQSIPSLGIDLVQAAREEEMIAIRRLQADTRVEFAEPNYVARAAGHLIPTDPLYEEDQLNLPLIGMPDAWDVTVGSSGVITALIDTGIDFRHPDLDSRIANLTGTGLPGADHVFLGSPSPGCPASTTPEDDGWTNPASPFNHGSHVAGIIAGKSTIAGDPAVGMAGIAPRTRVAPLKVLDCQGTGTFFDVTSAIAFAATRGAKLINMSLGTVGDSTGCLRSLQRAIDFAAARGLLLVAPSGNDGTTNRSIPAVCDQVVGVGATDNSDVIASFSQHNGTVDVSAPGVGIVGPGRTGQGLRTWFLASGTSMAAPHVAGCAALMLSIAPTLVPDQMETIFRKTVVDLGGPWRDDLYGSGRLNCGAAVRAATGPPPPTSTATATPTPRATRTPAPTDCPTGTQVSEDSWWGSIRSGSPPAASAVRSAAPVSSLMTDPVGDHLTSRGNPVVDIVSVEGGASLTDMTIRVNFSADTLMACVTGFIDLDTDQNAATGTTPSANRQIPGTSQVLGVDFSLILRPNGAPADVVKAPTGAVTGSVPATILRQSIEITVPLSLLGGDNGSMDLGMVLGNPREPTDAAPQAGHATMTLGIREATIRPSSLLAGETVDVLVDFHTSALMQTDDKIVIELPGGFDVSGITLVSKSGFDGQASLTVSGQRVVVARIPSLNTVAGTGPKSVALRNIANPRVPGTTGSFTIRHQNASEVDVEAAVLVPGLGIVGPTPTPTPPPGPGGRGFGITLSAGGVAMTWARGVGQTGYSIVRFSATEATILPPTGPLAATATSYTDNSRLVGFSCYVLLPLDGGSPIGASDLLCVIPNTRSATGAPQEFTLRLQQSNVASFTWTSPPGGGQDGYVLVLLGASAIRLSGTATAAVHSMSGPTCYVLVATSGSRPTGNTDGVCGVPGFSTLGNGGLLSDFHSPFPSSPPVPRVIPGMRSKSRSKLRRVAILCRSICATLSASTKSSRGCSTYSSRARMQVRLWGSLSPGSLSKGLRRR